MVQKKGGLGRGIGSLIPASPRASSVVPKPKASAVVSKTAAGAKKSTSAAAGKKPATKSAVSKSPVKKIESKSSTANSNNLVPVPGAKFAHIEISQIVANPKQPRKTFEPEAFAELVHSIKELGVLQPIVVRPISKPIGDAQFELIMGERRLRASKEAGLKRIPAIIRETANENMLRDALLENLHRADLNPLEEASAYQQLLEDFGITQDELADRIGRSRPQITNTIRLLKLPTTVQLKVAAGVLSAGHARAILGAAPTRRDYWANKVVNEGISVRTLEEMLALEKSPKEGSGKRAVPKYGTRLEILDELASKLGDRISTRVKIKLSRDKGQIIIDFANFADLKRILAEMEPEED